MKKSFSNEERRLTGGLHTLPEWTSHITRVDFTHYQTDRWTSHITRLTGGLHTLPEWTCPIRNYRFSRIQGARFKARSTSTYKETSFQHFSLTDVRFSFSPSARALIEPSRRVQAKRLINPHDSLLPARERSTKPAQHVRCIKIEI